MFVSRNQRTFMARSAATLASRRALAYATWNPADKNAGITLSGGDLIAAASGGNQQVRSTLGKSSGKWYWEYVQSVNLLGGMGGIATAAASLSNWTGQQATSWGYYGFSGDKYVSAANSAYGSAFALGDVISVALDMDNGRVWWGKNGTWQASGDPAAGTNAAFTGLTGTIYAAASGVGTVATFTANFGASAFAHTPPTGFNAGLYN